MRPCLSWSVVRGARREHALVITGLLVGWGASCRRSHLDERVQRPDRQASLLKSRDHQTARQFLSKLRRKKQSAFLVKLRSVGAEKYIGRPSLLSDQPLASTLRHCTHFAPPATILAQKGHSRRVGKAKNPVHATA